MTANNIVSSRDENILIVDDDSICISVFHDFFEDLDFKKIHSASTAKEAIQLLSSQKFDFIVVDMNMPDMNGIELSKYIRKHHNKKYTPIICCSSDFEKLRRQSIEAGIDDFLQKPFLPEDLKELLECWLPKKTKAS